jgi:hypothetical protein
MNKRKNGMFQWRKWGKYFVFIGKLRNFIVTATLKHTYHENLCEASESFYYYCISVRAESRTHGLFTSLFTFPKRPGFFFCTYLNEVSYFFIYKTATL